VKATKANTGNKLHISNGQEEEKDEKEEEDGILSDITELVMQYAVNITFCYGINTSTLSTIKFNTCTNRPGISLMLQL
jgi:hypothetical protein